jgi:amino acid transporter
MPRPVRPDERGEPMVGERRQTEVAYEARRKARTVPQSTPFRVLVGVGLVSFGIVHLVVAWIALQLAWGGGSGGQSADQQGALQQLSGTPIGPFLLWVMAIGLFALVPWMVGLTLWGYSWQRSSGRRNAKRAGALGRGVVYAFLGYTAAKIAAGSGQSSGNPQQKSLSARLLEAPLGQVLLVVVAAAIAAVGVYIVRRGLTKHFLEDLQGRPTQPVLRLGQVGYVARGLAVVIVAVLFAWSAIAHDPNKAGGLDQAFRTVKEQPFGGVLLTVMALGFVAFGLYCAAWSRRPRRA